MQREIKHQFTFPQPKEVVWDHLTTTELLAQWLMPNDFQPIVGHKFTLQTKPKTKFAFDGIIYCEVIEIIPYKNLFTPGEVGCQKKSIT